MRQRDAWTLIGADMDRSGDAGGSEVIGHYATEKEAEAAGVEWKKHFPDDRYEYLVEPASAWNK